MITKNGKTVSAKQWVTQSAINDVDMLTDFFYERHSEEWKAMSEKEQAKIFDQFNKLHNRILTLLNKSLKKE
jgi:hypothetical protein